MGCSLGRNTIISVDRRLHVGTAHDDSLTYARPDCSSERTWHRPTQSGARGGRKACGFAHLALALLLHANRSYAFLEGVKARAGDKLRGARRILLEGHPLPMSRNKQLVFGRTLLVGDAGGMVAHTSGEGIYFSMAAGRLAAQSLAAFFGYNEKLRTYEKRWQKRYGAMFDFLEFLEKASYTSNARREWFTDMCRVDTVQKLTFDSYLFKDLATVKPADHINLAYEGVISAVVNWWACPRTPLFAAPPSITAKEAVVATRRAIAAGVSVEEPA